MGVRGLTTLVEEWDAEGKNEALSKAGGRAGRPQPAKKPRSADDRSRRTGSTSTGTSGIDSASSDDISTAGGLFEEVVITAAQPSQRGVVVDGSSLLYDLFNQAAIRTRPYAKWEGIRDVVLSRLRLLQRCFASTTIVLDGPNPAVKDETSQSRLKQRAAVARRICTEYERRGTLSARTAGSANLLPPGLHELFAQWIMSAFGTHVAVVIGIGESDALAAAIAAKQGAYVLAKDSDFYIYNCAYMPLQHMVFDGARGQVHGKLFRRAALLGALSLANTGQLCVAASLAGNDYTRPEGLPPTYRRLSMKEAATYVRRCCSSPIEKEAGGEAEEATASSAGEQSDTTATTPATATCSSSSSCFSGEQQEGEQEKGEAEEEAAEGMEDASQHSQIEAVKEIMGRVLGILGKSGIATLVNKELFAHSCLQYAGDNSNDCLTGILLSSSRTSNSGSGSGGNGRMRKEDDEGECNEQVEQEQEQEQEGEQGQGQGGAGVPTAASSLPSTVLSLAQGLRALSAMPLGDISDAHLATFLFAFTHVNRSRWSSLALGLPGHRLSVSAVECDAPSPTTAEAATRTVVLEIGLNRPGRVMVDHRGGSQLLHTVDKLQHHALARFIAAALSHSQVEGVTGVRVSLSTCIADPTWPDVKHLRSHEPVCVDVRHVRRHAGGQAVDEEAGREGGMEHKEVQAEQREQREQREQQRFEALLEDLDPFLLPTCKRALMDHFPMLQGNRPLLTGALLLGVFGSLFPAHFCQHWKPLFGLVYECASTQGGGKRYADEVNLGRKQYSRHPPALLPHTVVGTMSAWVVTVGSFTWWAQAFLAGQPEWACHQQAAEGESKDEGEPGHSREEAGSGPLLDTAWITTAVVEGYALRTVFTMPDAFLFDDEGWEEVCHDMQVAVSKDTGVAGRRGGKKRRKTRKNPKPVADDGEWHVVGNEADGPAESQHRDARCGTTAEGQADDKKNEAKNRNHRRRRRKKATPAEEQSPGAMGDNPFAALARL